MTVFSFSSDIISRNLSNKVINIKNQSILSLVNDINFLKNNFSNYKEFTTLIDLNKVNNKLIIDILNDIKYLVLCKDSYIQEEVYNSLDKVSNLEVSREDPLNINYNIYSEVIKIIANKIMRQIHTNNVIFLNFKLDSIYGMRENKKYLLNEDEKRLVEKFNIHLEKICEIFKNYMPGLNIVYVNNGVYIDDIEKRSISIESNSFKEFQEEIESHLKENIIFNGEKIHVSNNGIRYCFKKARFENKDKLIIVFSAFSSDRPKYNYINTLALYDCNKLYILDDYGTKGSYYLGLNGTLEIETSVVSLISKIMAENDIKFNNVISVGSSKGGTAALYYGMKYNYGNIIVGAPQYKIGTYLSDLSIKTYADEIFGQRNMSSRIRYDNLIRLVCNNKSKINLLTSEGDKQYKRVLKSFEEVAKELDLNININKCIINNHNEIAKEFPVFLEKQLSDVLQVSKLKKYILHKFINYLNKN